MPFVKGQSGNPGGRPKVLAHMRDLAQQHGRKRSKDYLFRGQGGHDSRLNGAQAAVRAQGAVREM